LNESASTPVPETPEHQMPPMGEGPLAWGFAAFFLLPILLIVLVLVTPMCSTAGDHGTADEALNPPAETANQTQPDLKEESP
jgi:hypothetical protein